MRRPKNGSTLLAAAVAALFGATPPATAQQSIKEQPEALPLNNQVQVVKSTGGRKNFVLNISGAPQPESKDPNEKPPEPIRPWGIEKIERDDGTVRIHFEKGDPLEISRHSKSCAHIDPGRPPEGEKDEHLHFLLEVFKGVVLGDEIKKAGSHGEGDRRARQVYERPSHKEFFLGPVVVMVDSPVSEAECKGEEEEEGAVTTPDTGEVVPATLPLPGVFSNILWRYHLEWSQESDPKKILRYQFPRKTQGARLPRLDGHVFFAHQAYVPSEGPPQATVMWDLPGAIIKENGKQDAGFFGLVRNIPISFSTYVRHATSGTRELTSVSHKVRWSTRTKWVFHELPSTEGHGDTDEVAVDAVTSRDDHAGVKVHQGSLSDALNNDNPRNGWNVELLERGKSLPKDWPTGPDLDKQD